MLKKKSFEEIWKVLIKLSLACGVDYTTTRKWKERKAIPPSKHYVIVCKAKELGVKWCDHSFLHTMYCSAKKSKTRRKRQ